MAKKKGKKVKHATFHESAKLHNSVGGYDGGSCLSGHLSKYTSGDSCSYRWQGVKQAEDNSGPYDSHPKDYCRVKGAKLAKGFFRKLFLGGGENFHTGFMPYANQVHHILPSSGLRNGMDEATESKPDLIKTMCDGLLTQKYNINFRPNMIILASKWRDACHIGLPTHLGDHPDYTASIQEKVLEAMAPYASLADQGMEHDDPDFEDLKDDLEAISTSMYPSIVSYGQTAIKGKCKKAKITVNDLPAAVFAVLGV
jgi:hypothetical protein